MNPNSFVYRNCPSVRCLAHNFLNLVSSSHCLFQLMLSYDEMYVCFNLMWVRGRRNHGIGRTRPG
ncbi:hypothetical protein AtNW77_Chr1g0049111 [Arabidopsis thaliana]